MRGFCGGRSNSDDENNVDYNVVESQSSAGSRPNNVLGLVKCHDAYTTNYAYFSNDGPRHTLVIGVEEKGREKVEVTVSVDGRETCKKKNGFEGDGEFYVDGLEVDFSWDLRHSVPIFNFKTEEESYWIMIMGSKTAEEMGAIEEEEEDESE